LTVFCVLTVIKSLTNIRCGSGAAISPHTPGSWVGGYRNTAPPKEPTPAQPFGLNSSSLCPHNVDFVPTPLTMTLSSIFAYDWDDLTRELPGEH